MTSTRLPADAGCDDQPPVIAARGVLRRFGGVAAVDELTLQVRPGEVFGILGHNGAGKTTFLRLVNGLLRPSSGAISTFGLSAYENGARIRRRTGVVTESTSLDDFLSIRESLVAYGTMAGLSFDHVTARVNTLLEVFDLAAIADQQVRELSAGMRQRAAFARGLVHDPDLLLLDEPTANMDPVAARQVRRIVTDLARQTGRTVVISTHNLSEAQDVCDRIAVLRKGKLQAVGTMIELIRLVDRDAGVVTVRTDREHVQQAIEIAQAFGETALDPQPQSLVVRQVGVDRIPELVMAFVAAGVPVRGVAEVEPTLEEVYLALHHHWASL